MLDERFIRADELTAVLPVTPPSCCVNVNKCADVTVPEPDISDPAMVNLLLCPSEPVIAFDNSVAILLLLVEPEICTAIIGKGIDVYDPVGSKRSPVDSPLPVANTYDRVVPSVDVNNTKLPDKFSKAELLPEADIRTFPTAFLKV